MAIWLWGVAAATAAVCQLAGKVPDNASGLWNHASLDRLLEVLGSHPLVRDLCGQEVLDPAVGWASDLTLGGPDRLGPMKARGLLVLAGPVAGLVAAVLAATPALFFFGTAAGYGAVIWASMALKRTQVRQVAKTIPDAYRSLAGSLGAGQTLSQAIGYVGTHCRGPVGEAFRQGSFQLTCGASVEEALNQVCNAIDDPSTGLLSCALLVSQRTGAPLAPLLERSAELVEDKQGLEALLHTKTAQVRFSAAVVMGLPVLLVGLLLLISPDFRAGVASPVGLGSLLLATLLDLVAVFIMRSLLRGVLS